MKHVFAWCGDWIDPQALSLSENRSFLFGDGFFESMRFRPDGKCPLWPYHADRIQRSLAFLDFPSLPGDPDDFLWNRIGEVLPAHGTDLRVKMVLFRQGPGRYEPGQTRTAFFLEIETAPPLLQKISQPGFSETVWVHPGPGAWIKSTSAMLYVKAAQERKKRGLSDLILCDADGYGVEGSHSALFWKRGDALFLPDPDLGGLDSCFRRFLQSHCVREKRPVLLVRERPEEILDSDGIAFGSGTGIRYWEARPGSWPEEFWLFYQKLFGPQNATSPLPG